MIAAIDIEATRNDAMAWPLEIAAALIDQDALLVDGLSSALTWSSKVRPPPHLRQIAQPAALAVAGYTDRTARDYHAAPTIGQVLDQLDAWLRQHSADPVQGIAHHTAYDQAIWTVHACSQRDPQTGIESPVERHLRRRWLCTAQRQRVLQDLGLYPADASCSLAACAVWAGHHLDRSPDRPHDPTADALACLALYRAQQLALSAARDCLQGT